jgi:uncharacterized protein with PQ loop repeat
VKDVSLIGLLQISIGVALWIAYGFYRKDMVIIVANIITLLNLLALLLLYFHYGRMRK